MKLGEMSLKGLLLVLNKMERPPAEGTGNPNRLALTQGEGWHVSTVFLWDDDDGMPVYESIAFPDGSFEDLARVLHSSEEEARKGHEEMVEKMKVEGAALLAKWRAES